MAKKELGVNEKLRLLYDLQQIDSQIDEIKILKGELPMEVSDLEALIAKYEKQLDKVKNNREFDALNKEIEMQRLEMQLSEKKTREIKTQKDLKADTLVGAKERKENKEKDLQQKLVELKEIISKTEKDEDKLQVVSEKQQKKIEERLLKAYQKIRNTYRNGLAVVSVERNACGGCYNAIPPQAQMEIGLSKKILVCEHCGRILVDKATILAEEMSEA